MTIEELAVKQRNIARIKITEECERFARIENPSITEREIHQDILFTMASWLQGAKTVLGA